MTDQETIIQQRMTILELEDKVLTLRSALRDALNFAQETAVRSSGVGIDDGQMGISHLQEETIRRGLQLNEAYRPLLDGGLKHGRRDF